MARGLPGPEARAPPALSDHPLEEILVRIGSPADLVRASAACKTFRRLITDPTFLRRYRALHPPPLLGYVGPEWDRCALRIFPADAPHPNAPAARAFAVTAALVSFDHLLDCGRSGWPCYDGRDGRVLLMSSSPGDGFVSPELVVCDPLTGEYTLLPPIPDDMLASVLDNFIDFLDAFFDPSGGNDESQFRVICVVRSFWMAAVFVYSSVSCSWSHGGSIVYSALDLKFEDNDGLVLGGCRSYAYGCLYWDIGISNRMIKLDMNSMESTTISLPRDHANRQTIFVEAEKGRIRVFNLSYGSQHPQSLHYSIRQNECENANEHLVETTIPLPCEYDSYLFDTVAEGYIFLIGQRGDLTKDAYPRLLLL